MVVSYNPIRATLYAIQFGKEEQNGIFKRMSEDCTNFISQCIWAGYGGTDGYSLTSEADILALRERELRRIIVKPISGMEETMLLPPHMHLEHL